MRAKEIVGVVILAWDDGIRKYTQVLRQPYRRPGLITSAIRIRSARVLAPILRMAAPR